MSLLTNNQHSNYLVLALSMCQCVNTGKLFDKPALRKSRGVTRKQSSLSYLRNDDELFLKTPQGGKKMSSINITILTSW